MKKLLMIIMILILAVSLTTGCGPSRQGADEPGTGTNDTVAEEPSGPDEAAMPEDDGAAAEDESDPGPVAIDYNDPSTYIPRIPETEALDAMYVLLEGYWITTSESFVGFYKEGGEHWILYGLWQTSYGTRGQITDGFPTGTYEAALDIFIPALEATEMDDAQPERAETVYIDLTDLIQNQKIKFKTENLEAGGWGTYEFGGDTTEQAFNNWYEE